MPLRILLARIVALILLLPAGLLCVSFPFARFALPGGGDIIADTRAAFGAGTDGGKLKAYHVDCVRERSGSNSSRGIGITEYGCVIDLAEEQEKPPPPPEKPKANRTFEEAMADHNSSIAAALESVSAHSRRMAGSNRIERQLATNRTGHLPAVRILSAPGEQPRRIGLVWGFGELAWRWGQWLVTSLLFFGFGGGCLFAVYIAWKRR
ncbi:hypothetical protein FHS91_003194 [Sphingobium xanthum]|uniref:hypothetical protein n=1 Tax=Sphingobium xanthum TaxID=1387165 RepID=UPI001C8C9C73|nr:hypothetical protein [Sphingobium xanthum]